MEEEEEKKPIIETKSSMEILSELFGTFHAEPPIIVDDEDTKMNKLDEENSNGNKHKKKKKHKSKDKKHKKKGKKRKHSCDSSSSNDDSREFDLSKLLIKKEEQSNEIKIKGTEISLNLDKIEDTVEEKDVKPLIKKEKTEEGEISSGDDHKHRSKVKKKKSKHKDKKSDKKDKISDESIENSEKFSNKSDHSYDLKDTDEYTSYYGNRTKDDFRQDYRSRSPHRYSDSKYKHQDEHKDYENRRKYNPFYNGEESYKREKERSNKEDFRRPNNHHRNDRSYNRRSEDRYRDRNYRDRSWSPNKESSSYIDKKKLLEIARKNAIIMMKSGSLPGALTLGPHAQEKVIAAIKAGGKTIEELTDFCKTLSTKEDLGELSDVEDDKGSESDNEKPFNHPFQIKDRPTTITMNIKNSVPLPVKSTQERTSELRMQFPVSSGQLHRKNENEWTPVAPKKPKPSTKQIVPSVIPVPPVPDVLPTPPAIVPAPVPETQSSIDISAIVSERLSALRKLQENPHDVQALTQVSKASKEVQSWAESKQQPGQFTGSVAGNFLSQSELSSGYQAWAKKDQLQVAAPVSGGMGMHLLQKMGWKPGEGLGKEKSGALEPLLLEVKLDKKGLVANEETKKKRKMKIQQVNQKVNQVKHPVSLLGEYACKNKYGVPVYELCFECGPDHKKNFLFKVVLNGMEFQPNIASPNKKEAKANAATLCLQKLGVL